MFKKLAAFGIPLLSNDRFIELPNKSINYWKFNNYKPIDTTISKPKVSVLFLPGTGVKPSEYFPVLQNLKDKCKFNNIDVDVNIVKFTLDLSLIHI